MNSRCRSFSVFLLGLFCLFAPLAASSAVAQSKTAPKADAAEPQEPEQTPEVFENLTEHFEKDTEQRGFPMNLFPAGTHGGLVLAALGAGAVGGLLALGGGSIAIVNYESQTSPQSKPDERLAARSAGRVGLGVFGLGTLLLFAPPMLIDWALPQPVARPSENREGQEVLLPVDPTEATPVESTPESNASQDLKKLKKKKEKQPSSGPSKNKTKKKKEPQKKTNNG